MADIQPSPAAEPGQETGRKVVVAMDGSPESLYALKWFRHNLHKPDDKILIAHAHELHHKALWVEGEQTPVEKLKPALEEERKKVQEKIAFLKKALEDQQLNGEVHNLNTRKPGEGIVKFAKEVDATLIVTGTRGLGSIRRTILGSVSDYILHHSEIPVVVCHNEGTK